MAILLFTLIIFSLFIKNLVIGFLVDKNFFWGGCRHCSLSNRLIFYCIKNFFVGGGGGGANLLLLGNKLDLYLKKSSCPSFIASLCLNFLESRRLLTDQVIHGNLQKYVSTNLFIVY